MLMSSESVMSPLPKPEVSRVPSASVTRRIFRSHLSKWSLGLGWSTLLLLHVLCTLFYACAAWIYHVTPGTNLWWMPGGLELSIHLEHYPTVAIVHLVVAIVHGTLALRTVVSSLWARKLVFRLRSNKVAPPPTSSSSTGASRVEKTGLRLFILQGSSMATTQARANIPQPSLRDRGRRVYEALAGRYGLLGVENAHYDSINLVRELLQTLWQTYQAYWMSVLLTRTWLNHLYVACIVINCWSAPLVHLAFKKSGNVLKERVILLATDMVLDFLTTVVLPSALFLPYYQDFKPAIKDFPQANWYDPKWFIKMIFEFQMLLVQSWRDLAFRMCFAANLLCCMDIVKSLLEETPRKCGSSRLHPAATITAEVEPTLVTHRTPDAVTGANEPASEPPTRETKLQALAYGLLVIFGLVVLIVHLQANLKKSSSLCVLEVQPWFTRQPACFYFELNCARANVNGSAQEIELLLDEIDALVLASFDIVHCPTLELSAKLKSFSRLMVITISFSNIIKWDSEAALTGVSHPRVRNLNFYGTNFTNGVLPEGVLSSDPLKLLTQVNIVHANLARLPEDLDAKWPILAFFYCEMTQLTEFPAVLTKMKIADLSLVGNQIREVPSEIFMNERLYGLYLNANLELSELPTGVDLKLPKSFQGGEFYGSNLSTLPEYVDEAYFLRGGYFVAGGTPLCAFIEKQLEDDGELSGVLSNVDCEPMSSDRLTVIPYFRIKDTNLPSELD